MYLEQNLKGLCQQHKMDYEALLDDLEIDDIEEISLQDLEILCEEYQIDLYALLFKPLFLDKNIRQKLAKIKLLVLDVDGVMTDGGMYFTEKGDHIKKYNAKDGMAIQTLVKRGFQTAIISAGYMQEVVQVRARLLGIQHCHVTQEPKLEVLNRICGDLGIALDEVALIGDDINDLEMMQNIGFSACPADAVNQIKFQSDIVLSKKGGEACVREFVDAYLMKAIG
ncbi:MAG TPA: HAD hydrolase family protein [Saprospiraceae bacterium]|nr:HAD hydrolase family protein [Saprospiraceae bacterium]MCC6688856.1 HAD hydrolase family protein [Saprospiraceae bacterium]HMV25084.1 HAD hydrolase family protein [Saprospiraceae bacterium]HMW76106.1 HAD hydrolase family protein [Saprospiraceae bacterium]HMX82892.1 HAD hydrolase family protein [Saprospiraceae bacterium]